MDTRAGHCGCRSIEVLESRIAPAFLYVDNPGDFIITTDVAPAGLSNGDRVTWDPGPGTVFGDDAAETDLRFGIDAFSSIQAAINAADGQDLIRVAPGTFNESVTINKTVSLVGAQNNRDPLTRTGPETIVTHPNGAFSIFADNVFLGGFTVRGQTANGIGAGIVTFSGANDFRVENNIVEDNIVGIRVGSAPALSVSRVSGNLLRDNDNPGTGSGTAIRSDFSIADLTISENTIVGVHTVGIDILGTTGTTQGIFIQRNTISGPGSGDGIRLAANLPATAAIAIGENIISGWSDGVEIGQTSPNKDITVRGNNLQGNVSRAIRAQGPTILDAGFNFYGVTTTSEIGALLTGNIDFQPFLTDGTDGNTARGFQPVLPGPEIRGNVATFRDADGDLVTVKVNKGALAASQFTFTLPPLGDGFLLKQLNLTAAPEQFSGAAVSITAKPTAAGGDGAVNVFEIKAFGIDLASIQVGGDLANLTVGDSNTNSSGLKSLTVNSIGAATFDRGSVFVSGTLEKLVSKGDVQVDMFVRGDLGSATILGSFHRNNLLLSGGSLDVSGNAGPITVKGSLIGGDSFGDGTIRIEGNVARVTIGGNLVGGDSSSSGSVEIGGNAGPIVIRGSILGGEDGGELQVSKNASKITVLGSIVGGNGFNSGVIRVGGNLGVLTVGGDLRGGSDFGAGSIIATQRLGTAAIHGSVIGGSDANTGSIQVGTVGLLTIDGDLSQTNADFPVRITASGVEGPSAQTQAVAIGQLVIKGSVENAQILAGFSGSSGVNPDAAIGSVTVFGSWRASSLSAGISTGPDNRFGTADDSAIPASSTAPDSPAIVARIASVLIKGNIFGTLPSRFETGGIGDHFGLLAEQFVQVKVGGVQYSLTGGVDQLILGGSLDTVLREV